MSLMVVSTLCTLLQFLRVDAKEAGSVDEPYQTSAAVVIELGSIPSL